MILSHELSHRLHTRWLHWLLAALWSAAASAQPAATQGELVAAARAGDLAKASQLLQQGVSANAATGRVVGEVREDVATAGITTPGDTALAAAARSGSAEIVRLLLANGALANCPGVQGTPLAQAALHGHAAVAELLLAAGADPNARDGAGAAPLYRAALAGDLRLLQRLLAAGADPNLRSPPVGGSVDAPGSGLPLVEAAKRGRLDMVRALLESGARVNVRGADGKSPLFWAIVSGGEPVALELLDAGSDPREQVEGYGLAHFAQAMGREQVSRRLAPGQR
jgi:ankyrin repeat protein